MSDDIKSFSGVSLGLIPQLKDDGSNWWDFFRRLEETLTMSGFADTMQQSNEPCCPIPPVEPHDGATQTHQAEHMAAQALWLLRKEEYDKAMVTWNERQARACMAIRSKCGFNNYQKVKPKIRVYHMIDVLRAGREMGSGKLMELTTRFYALHLADCESIADFSGQLSQINHQLQDLHPSTAFSEVQLILRFLQGLGSAYDIFITTLTQATTLIATSESPATTFNTVVQKAYNEEKRQSSSISGSGTALVAYSRPSNSNSTAVDFCTHCKKPRHNEQKCFLKYPRLKKEYDEKRKARSKRKNSDSNGKEHLKKQRFSNPPLVTELGETAAAMAPLQIMTVAIDNQASGDIVPPPCTDQAMLAPSNLPLQNDWILDTGCTNHATGTLSHFTEITMGNYGICGGVGGSVRFEGIGTVKIPVPGPNGDTAELNLQNVKYCPEMGPFNLISISQLFKQKRGKPSLTEDSIFWMVGNVKVNASAKHGLWLLDRAK